MEKRVGIGSIQHQQFPKQYGAKSGNAHAQTGLSEDSRSRAEPAGKHQINSKLRAERMSAAESFYMSVTSVNGALQIDFFFLINQKSVFLFFFFRG